MVSIAAIIFHLPLSVLIFPRLLTQTQHTIMLAQDFTKRADSIHTPIALYARFDSGYLGCEIAGAFSGEFTIVHER